MGLISFSKRVIRQVLVLKFPGNDNRLLAGQSAIHSMLSRRADFRYLWDAEVKVFSQWGEDGILTYLCWELELIKPNVIEFGVGDFSECNSRFLAEFLNANVVAVDVMEELRDNNLDNDLRWKTHFTPLVHWITPEQAMEDLSSARMVLGGIDIVSLDLDGNDYWIMNNLDLSGVSIVVVEYNALFGPTSTVTIPRDDSFSRTKAHFSNLYYGASLSAWICLMTKKNFRFIGSNLVGNNAFFVANKNLGKLNLPLPEISDLSIYTNWYVREGRDINSDLTLRNAFESKIDIGHLELYDVLSHEIYLVSELSD